MTIAVDLGPKANKQIVSELCPFEKIVKNLVYFFLDDDPPVVSCPSTQQAIVYLDDEQDVSNSDLLSRVSYTDASTVQTRLLLAPDNPITFADLYKTYTYTYEATDENGNRASCQGQVFISGKIGLSMIKPVFGVSKKARLLQLRLARIFKFHL